MLLHVADGCEDSRWREIEDDKIIPNDEGDDYKDDQEKDAAEEPCYRILPIPGKGQGMVATRKLYPGEVVMTERPLLVVPDTIFRDYSRVEAFIERRINRMSCEDRDRFLGLTDCRNVMGHAYCGRYMIMFNKHCLQCSYIYKIKYFKIKYFVVAGSTPMP